ncbi:MAG: ABC transporter substrate-binding protein [Thermodesulfobacteriota bacterium]
MKRLVAVLVGLTLVFLYASVLPAQPKLKAGVLRIVSTLPFYMALHKKFFLAEGIRVELEYVAGGAKALPAVAGGSLHMAQSNYISLIMAHKRGMDFVLIAPINRNKMYVTGPKPEDGSPIMVRKDSGITSVKGLKGKILAVNTRRNINHLYMAEWLAQSGVHPEKDVKWIEVPFPRIGPVVRSGQAAAGFYTEPFVTLERGRGGMRIIGYPYAEVEKGRPLEISGFVSSRSWVEKNKANVERFVRGFYRGQEFTNAHPEEWPAVIGKYTRVKPQLLKKMRLWNWHHPVDLKSLQHQADLALKWEVIESRVDVKSFVYPTALR